MLANLKVSPPPLKKSVPQKKYLHVSFNSAFLAQAYYNAVCSKLFHKIYLC